MAALVLRLLASTSAYHLLANPSKLQRLRAELKIAVPAGRLPAFAQVETLPYLSAVIQEGLRLHPAVSSRQQRVAPPRGEGPAPSTAGIN